MQQLCTWLFSTCKFLTPVYTSALLFPCRDMQVMFRGEPAYGAGVVREWLSQLAPLLFGPERGLFVRCGGNPLAILPSPSEPRLSVMRRLAAGSML